MMKRIISLLLAAMVLMGSAMADATKVTVTWDADVEGAKLFWQESSGAEGATLQNIAEGLVELMENLKVEFITQDSGAYLSIALKDTVLFDFGTESGWDYSHVFSNLWEGYYISTHLSQEQVQKSEKAIETLDTMDWIALGENLVGIATDWLNEQPTVEEHGNFVGDTYEGGVLRRSYTFDDQEAADLVERLLLSLESAGITEELLQNYLGEELDIWSGIRRKNTQVAEENRFSYILRECYGPSGEFMGASLVVLENDQQVMTLSYGLAANGWRLVWGYGLNGQNYYLNLDMIAQETGDGFDMGLFLFGDADGQGFRSVESSVENLLMMVSGSFYPQKEGEWSTLAAISVMGPSMDQYVVEGLDKDVSDAEYTVKWYRGEVKMTPLQTVHINVEPCENMTWDISGMTAIDNDADGSDELLNQLMQEKIQEIVLTLFKLVPTQLLTMLMM